MKILKYSKKHHHIFKGFMLTSLWPLWAQRQKDMLRGSVSESITAGCSGQWKCWAVWYLEYLHGGSVMQYINSEPFSSQNKTTFLKWIPQKKKKRAVGWNLLTGSKEMENVTGVLEYELVMHFKCGLEFHTFFSLPRLNWKIINYRRIFIGKANRGFEERMR